ncbi:Uncharacterised protein [Citrobacter freundii]|nr:Uncharacterised protein [Citrobacter freundii]
MKRKGIFSLVFLMTPFFMPGKGVAAGEVVADGGQYSIDFDGQLVQTTCDTRFKNDLLYLSPIGVDEFSEQRLAALQ